MAAQPPNPLFGAVGARLRALRHERQLTLDQLSASSGVSRRMIALLEAGESNASLGTLDKLARALVVEFAALVTDAPLDPLMPAATTGSAALWEDGRGSSARLLHTHAGPASVELWQWQLSSGGRYDAEADPPGSEELILVSAGRVAVEAGGRRFPLGPGDYLRLPTDTAYAYENPGPSPAHFVRVVVMPHRRIDQAT